MVPSLVTHFRRRVLLLGSGLLLTFGLGVVLQRRVVESSGRLAREAALLLPLTPSELPLEPDAEPAVIEPLVHAEDFEETTEDKKRTPKKKVATIVVPGSVTQGWVTRGIIPDVSYVPPSEGLPGGLVTASASSFVPGLGDGDRLTHVDGAPIRSLEGVVSLVARAVRERRNVVRATFCRKDGLRIVCVHLAIELPREAIRAELDPE